MGHFVEKKEKTLDIYNYLNTYIPWLYDDSPIITLHRLKKEGDREEDQKFSPA
jgi:hypothetical protein